MALRKGAVLLIFGIAVFVPSIAHAHGFPWWFGAVVILPFQLGAVLLALPCKVGILRLGVLDEHQLVPWSGLLKLMFLELGVLFISIWVFETATHPIRDFLYNLIDSTIGPSNRVSFNNACDTVIAFLVGAAFTSLCTLVLWIPHFRVLSKVISGKAENSSPVDRRRLLPWSLLVGSVGPAIFWIPASLRLL